ncbi:uncharacterized protein OCT59_013904 [Rhizophagus irregularis]|uniref:Uncharacterized protein n=1 Tax=Rhizophagus irregularis (strain DAOM 181602 / DAOM 197198 / MUCL 43194) TaxID=747089 RepID=A0A2P4P519_RHIID|nr:hypothetical protein GLOIN_2v1787840 [Rhizophagus irregularis DAOM 181602=DAOM 197198]POG60479.1 hypothetical protein GLOIN_2v1787840 [Rhizophagus irregularis DAOM 181602=DAOM 197198]UZO21513.1 hypothetical protein OCT59_013904 [Rhizophagus irregularis]|eukprot:XP_025167345.1 hypothetical protein GLOIN_2v1787840 [Rhizophagus irregularis DAOM 181602=DAOM 197198]
MISFANRYRHDIYLTSLLYQFADLEQTEEDKEMAKLYTNQLLLMLRSCPLDDKEFIEGNNILQWLFANNILRDEYSFRKLSVFLHSPKPVKLRISLGKSDEKD